MYINTLSESYKDKMKSLSGISTKKSSDFLLLKESYFLTEEEVLNEGIKDAVLGLMTLLTTITTAAELPSEKIKQEFLNLNIKNKKELFMFKNDLESKIGNKKNTQDYQEFIKKLNSLYDMIGSKERGSGTITSYNNIFVREFEYNFNLNNEDDKRKLDELLSKVKNQKGVVVISNDTLIKMMSVVQPRISTKMQNEIKIDNQNFKNYNDYKVDPQIIKDIAEKIKLQFIDFETVGGYILVHGSASNVPTTLFGGSNELLAEARACSLATQLEEQLGDKFKNKIKVDSKVNGPDFANDKENVQKYAPYQFSKIEINLTASKQDDKKNDTNLEQIMVTVKTLQANIGSSAKPTNSIALLSPQTKIGKSSTACPIN